MKILRDTEWKPVGFEESFSLLNGPAFFFQHRKHGDIVATRMAKYVDVSNNIVYFFDANRRDKVCVSRNCKTQVDKSAISGLLSLCGI